MYDIEYKYIINVINIILEKELRKAGGKCNILIKWIKNKMEERIMTNVRKKIGFLLICFLVLLTGFQMS